jgi:biotin-dependent carboxylase-like uncharacterized protein
VNALRVLEPGPSTVVQDLGRPGREHEGIAPSGAFDRAAHARACRLVGNAPRAAGLEVLVGGLAVVAEGDLVIAVTGAVCPVEVDGRAEAVDVGLVVRAGAVLRVGPVRSGIRAYLAVRGGFAVAPVLGSRSWDAGGRFGPPPLAAGAVLPVGDDIEGQPRYEPVVVPPTVPSVAPPELALLPGPHDELLDAGGAEWLRATAWEVRPESDRMGVRLVAGAAPPREWLRALPGGLPSFPVVPGSVQVLPSGDLVVLGPDAGVTGGYAVVGVVDRDALDVLAQAAPGDRVRIRPVTRRSPRQGPGASRGDRRQYQ